jgi:hypothetical protein
MWNNCSESIRELRRCILRHLGRRVGKTMTQLRYDVEDDYGPVGERRMYRHLDFLLQYGLVRRQRDADLQWETIDATTSYPVYFYFLVSEDRLPRHRVFCRICGLTHTRTSSHPEHLRAARSRGYGPPVYVSIERVLRSKTAEKTKTRRRDRRPHGSRRHRRRARATVAGP